MSSRATETFSRVIERVREFIGCFLFLALMSIPVALGSLFVTAWPVHLQFPVGPLVASSAGIICGMVGLFIVAARSVEGAAQGAQVPVRPDRTVIAASLVSAVSLSFFVVTLIGILTKRAAVEWGTVAAVALSTALGLAVFLVMQGALSSGWVGRYAAVFLDPRSRKRLGIAVVLGLLFCLGFVVLGRAIASEPESTLVKAFRHNPGGVFTLLMGVATLAGLYLTIHGISEFRKTITTFPDLIKRLCELIESTSEDDYVRYLCYTPLTGEWGVPDYLWRRFYALVKGMRYRISVVTLDAPDLVQWYHLFVGRRTVVGEITGKKAQSSITNAEAVLEDLRREARERGDQKIRPARLRMDQMPGFYFFSNRERAIVVSPVFLPLPAGTSEKTQIQKLESVQMVGVESIDLDVISWINKLHEVYRDDVSVAEDIIVRGEAEAQRLPDGLKALISGKEGSEAFLRDEVKVGYRVHVYSAGGSGLRE